MHPFVKMVYLRTFVVRYITAFLHLGTPERISVLCLLDKHSKITNKKH